MKKILKKVLALSLCACMVVGMATGASAADINIDYDDGDIVFLVNLLPVNVIGSDEGVVKQKNNNKIKTINNTTEYNYYLARQLLDSVPFEENNLVGGREIYLAELNKWEQEGVLLLDEYSISLRSEENWGSYQGVPMRATFASSNRQYEKTLGSSSISDWVKGTINIAMVWNPSKLLSCAYSLYGSFIPTYTSTTSDVVRLSSRETLTSRVIYCKDINGTYGPTSQYIGQVADQMVSADLSVYFSPIDRNIPQGIKNIHNNYIINTDNYYNVNAAKKEAYTNYIYRRGLVAYTVPSAYLITQRR